MPPTLDSRKQTRRIADEIVPTLISRIVERLDNGDQRMNSTDAAIERLEQKIDTNSADTAEVLDILRLGRSFFRLAGYFGTFVKWTAGITAAIISAWVAWKSGRL